MNLLLIAAAEVKRILAMEGNAPSKRRSLMRGAVMRNEEILLSTGAVITYRDGRCWVLSGSSASGEDVLIYGRPGNVFTRWKFRRDTRGVAP